MSRGRGALLGIVALMLFGAPGAQAAFPGANGKIAYTSIETGASTINPDGTGEAAFNPANFQARAGLRTANG
jgi:hypothetical protein